MIYWVHNLIDLEQKMDDPGFCLTSLDKRVLLFLYRICAHLADLIFWGTNISFFFYTSCPAPLQLSLVCRRREIHSVFFFYCFSRSLQLIFLGRRRGCTRPIEEPSTSNPNRNAFALCHSPTSRSYAHNLD